MRDFDLILARDSGFVISGYMNKVGYPAPFLIKTDSMGCDGLYSCMDTAMMMLMHTWADSVCIGDSLLVSIDITNGNAPFTCVINNDTLEELLYIAPDTASYFFYAHPTITNNQIWATIIDSQGQTFSSSFTCNMVDCSISVDEIAPVISFNIYPNPASKTIQLNIFKGRYLQNNVEIYNQAGKLIMQIPNVQHKMQLDIGTLPSGVYYLKLISKEGVGVEKFVVVRE